jgi:type IV pilus assembly protein PilW
LIHSSNRQRGLSLIELLIALFLGLLVVGAVIQLFIGSRATQMSNEALARVQENGRFSIELLKREFRDVGTHGFCAADIEIRNHLRSDCANYVNSIYDPNRAFVGWEYDSTGRGEAFTLDEADVAPTSGSAGSWSSADGAGTINLPDILDGEVVPGSDVVIIRSPRVVPDITADGNQPPNANAITLNGSSTLERNEIVLITNCTTGADLFQNRSNGNASAVSGGSGSCANPGPGNQNGLDWSTAYDESMQMFRIRVTGYYIGYNATTGEPGLYRADLSEGTDGLVTEELVEGVETMQILYGYSLPIDQGGNGQSVDFWLPADEVPDWQFVIGVRMSLLLRSPDNMADGAARQTFDLASTQFTHPEDRRLRQPFFTSISLRNRQLVL